VLINAPLALSALQAGDYNNKDERLTA